MKSVVLLICLIEEQLSSAQSFERAQGLDQDQLPHGAHGWSWGRLEASVQLLHVQGHYAKRANYTW